MDLPEVHAQALEATRPRVAGGGAHPWGAPTPCDDRAGRTLLNHITSGNFWVTPLVAGQTIEEVGDRLDGDVLGDDPLATYEASAGEAAASFRGPGAMDAPVAVSYGPVPGSVYCGHRFIDVLIHGWDLATATGQNTTLPSDLVEACFEVVEPQRQLLEGSGQFGTVQQVGEHADRQTQLLAILGRQA